MLGREYPTRPTVEELGARSEQRQAQLMAVASASAPHNSTLAPNRRSHYDRQATVEKIAANEVPSIGSRCFTADNLCPIGNCQAK